MPGASLVGMRTGFQKLGVLNGTILLFENTPPECLAASVSCGGPCCLRPFGAGSAPGVSGFEATYAFTFVAAR
jgi:hypothetical protein